MKRVHPNDEATRDPVSAGGYPCAAYQLARDAHHGGAPIPCSYAVDYLASVSLVAGPINRATSANRSDSSAGFVT